MAWVKPEFGDFLCPPTKRQKTENSPSVLNENRNFRKNLSSESDVSVKLNLLGKYCPETKEELVVNKKKIEEVEYWLKNIEHESTYLLLTGPPGCGKLRTLYVLCKSLKLDVVEWTSPISHTYDPDSFNPFYKNELDAFEEFILRASRYSNVLSQSAKRIIVVKDIPNGFLRNNPVFHNLLERYFGIEKMRIVFIISDFTVCRELFPESVKSSFFVKNINFNPITQRSISGALNNIVKRLDLLKINKNLGTHIEQISLDSNGDLRNAIATLQFFLVNGKFESIPQTISKRKTKVGKAKGKPVSVTDSNTSCDNKIDIFHGLGRVLYAKREDGKLVHNPQDVADSFTSCPQLFVGMLHENYLNTFSSIHDIAKASDHLAASDMLLQDWDLNSSITGCGVSVASHSLMSLNSQPIKKFQQFNKPSWKQQNLVKQYKDLLEADNHSWKGLDILMDISPYIKKISYFESIHKDLYVKLGKFY